MRTLQIGDRWLSESEGGLSRYYFELLRHLPAKGVDVRGLVVGGPEVAAETAGIVRAFARADAPLLQRWRSERAVAAQMMVEFAPDLIVSHFALYSLPLIGRFSRLPSVIHFHGPWAGESLAERQVGMMTRIKAAIEGMAYKRASLLIVLSQAFANLLSQQYGVPEELIRIVPGGIDLERFNISISRAAAREQLGLSSDRPTVFCIRRQVRRMGLENLLHATASVAREIADVQVLLGGTGPLGPELETLIRELGLGKNVRQLGRVPDADLPLYYRAADVSIAPTVALEGFGLITLESLACGTPVLVTPVGGLSEVVRPLSAACVLENSSPEALADGLMQALRGTLPMPSEAQCRRYAADNFSWDKIAGQVAGVYREAVR